MDKTRLIEQLLAQWGEVNLFTRPRRFGKSLNMSMFQHFFEIGSKKSLFDGLDISKNHKLCEEYQGRYPVVSISLKGINGRTYEEARDYLVKTINEEGRVIEVKYASDGDLEKECEKALQQIIDVGYTESLEQEGIHKIIKYRIACYKKKCKVVMKIEE